MTDNMMEYKIIFLEELAQFRSTLSLSRYNWLKGIVRSVDENDKDKIYVAMGYIMGLRDAGVYTGNLKLCLENLLWEMR